MTIEMAQTCDGCGQSRSISFGYYGQPRDRESARKTGGWLVVKEFKDLCSKCVDRAISAETEK